MIGERIRSDVAVALLWSCIASDGEGLAIGGRQSHGHHLVSGKLTAQGFPRSVDTLFQEGALDADRQVIGQHKEEDVGFNPSLQMIGATGSHGHRALRASSRLISLSLTYRWVSSRFKIEGVSHGGHGGHGGFLNR